VETLERRELLAGDVLYVSDPGTDSVQRFDANSGAYLGTLVAGESGGFHGPNGLVIDQGQLLLVNQNRDLPKAGEVLRFDPQTGNGLGKLVSYAQPGAPFSPAGIVVRDSVAYVADVGEGSPSGRVAKFDATTGEFLGDLVPQGFTGEFRPRGLVFGPDGGLYVTVSSIAASASSDPPGHVLAFDVSTSDYRVFAWNDGDGIPEAEQGEAVDLHNPVGIVFAPDGRPYVISNRNDQNVAGADENTRIVILDPITGNELSYLELDPHTHPAKNPTRLFAAAMLFGPEGKLYIPVLVESLADNSSLGAIVTYDPTTQQTSAFYANALIDQSIIHPGFLTFGQTDPATLTYLSTEPPVLYNLETSPLLLDGPLTVGHLYGGSTSGLGGRVSDVIQVSDADDIVTGATVRITTNYHSDQDQLRFSDQGAITGHWDQVTGTLTLSGRDRADAYRSALQSIFYFNSELSPNLERRTVSFTVHDSLSTSNTVTRDLLLIQEDLNALFYTVGGTPFLRYEDALLRRSLSTGVEQVVFSVPGIQEGGFVVADGSHILSVGRNSDFVCEGFCYFVSHDRGLLLQFPDADGGFRGGTTLVRDDVNEAPVDPEGVVLNGKTLYVADTRSGEAAGGAVPPGRIRRYDATTGAFLNDITTSGYGGLFHPRGLVFGPDGALYVSLFDPRVDEGGKPLNPGYGAILRIDSGSPVPVVVAFNNGDEVRDVGETPDLHNPASLVFDPDGKLYVATTSTASDGLDQIIVLDPTADTPFTEVDHIEITRASDAPLHTRSMLFGPEGKLYVSVNEPRVNDSKLGQGFLRVYDVATKNFDVFIPPNGATSAPIGYFSFGYTNPKTLAFEPPIGATPVVSSLETNLLEAPTNTTVQVSNTLEISDSDSGMLSGALVRVTTGYDDNQDVLTFTDTANINGFWNQSAGTLRLVGAATVAQYQAALRSIRFQNNSPQFVIPTLGTRTIELEVSDGNHTSSAVTREVRVSLQRGDYLFVGDQGNLGDPTDDTIKQFSIQTNNGYLGNFVTPGQVNDPGSIVFSGGHLIVANQGIDQAIDDIISRFNGKTGASLQALVSVDHPHVPFALRGIVVKNNVMYVADAGRRRILEFDATTGDFLDSFAPDGFTPEFRPRGLVFGPDGKLYVSVSSDANLAAADAPGYILRFDVGSRAYEVVAANDGDGNPTASEVPTLHNPEGIVFGPDGLLYVTSLLVDSSENGISVIDPTKKQQPRFIPLGNSVAHSLLFGPHDLLYLPINSGQDTGSIRLYDTQGNLAGNIPSSGNLIKPTYLTFAQTDPATLQYKPWHNFVNPLDVDGDGNVVPLDTLLIINELKHPTVTDSLGQSFRYRPSGGFYYDVNADGYVTPLDVLQIINYVNSQPRREAEGVDWKLSTTPMSQLQSTRSTSSPNSNAANADRFFATINVPSSNKKSTSLQRATPGCIESVLTASQPSPIRPSSSS